MQRMLGSIDRPMGSLVINFDGEYFAKTIANKAEGLFKIDPELAKAYLKCMSGLTVTIKDNSAHYEHHNHD